MGVKGLWQLLLPIGRRISIETLEGKVLAIDASIWMTQFLKAMRDPETGRVQNAAHLIGFLRRLCRLRFHGIRPVLVFDGATPEIKKLETARRRARREKFASLDDAGVQKLAKRLLAKTLEQQKLTRGNHGSTKAAASVAPAMAPGFRPNEQVAQDEEHGNAVQTSNESPSAATQTTSFMDDEDSKPAARRTDDEVVDNDTANDEAIALTLAEEEYRSRESTEKVSDWDLPIAGSDGADNKDKPDKDGANDDSSDDDEWNPTSSTRNDETNPMTIERIAVLPSYKRKDAIELAKRQQRVRSRREFMPAAADPADFSSVQVTNFLRSTNLNKSIHDMAVKEVANKERRGEVSAGNNSSRIVFIREDEKKINSSSSQQNVKRRFVAFHDDGSSDDDNHHNSKRAWYTGTRRSASSHLQTESFSSSGDQSDTSEEYEESTVERNQESGLPTLRAQNLNQPAATHEVESLGMLDIMTDEKAATKTAPHTPEKKASRPKVEALKEDCPNVDLSSCKSKKLLAELTDSRYSGASIEIESKLVQSDAPGASASSMNGIDSIAKTIVPLTGQEKSSAKSLNDNDDEDTDGSIDWEDGATSEVSLGNAAKACDLATKDNRTEGISDCPPCEQAEGVNERSSGKVIDETMHFSGRTKTSNDPEHELEMEHVNSSSIFSDETAAALARAEGTASNLANWAGRAFRRAMQEVGGSPQKREIKQSPQKKPPLPVASTVGTPEKALSSLRNHVGEQSADNIVESPYFGRKQAPGHEHRAENQPQISQETETLIETFNEQWKSERNQRERDMDTITDEMKIEILELLQVFGVPYVEAPAEAESQCVALEELGLVDGIVTEDSDVFVFGGQRVYKNIFADKMYAEAYVAKDAEKEMKLNRNSMIALAMLLGSDYTEGVKGVGVVNSMEVLQAFDVTNDLKAGLCQFREWLNGFDPFDEGVVQSNLPTPEAVIGIRAFHLKHKAARTRWIVPESFPADNVIHSFSSPVVDNSTQRFSWGVPDIDRLAAFCSRYMGWSLAETKQVLDPVIEKVSSTGYRQTRIDSFMSYEDSITFAKVRSKRLRDVLGIDINKPRKKARASEKESDRKASPA